VNLSKAWDMPSYLTEMYDCPSWTATAAANVSHSWWHYSDYCTTGPSFGNRSVPSKSFGACILGWGGGNVNDPCSRGARAAAGRAGQRSA